MIEFIITAGVRMLLTGGPHGNVNTSTDTVQNSIIVGEPSAQAAAHNKRVDVHLGIVHESWLEWLMLNQFGISSFMESSWWALEWTTNFYNSDRSFIRWDDQDGCLLSSPEVVVPSFSPPTFQELPLQCVLG